MSFDKTLQMPPEDMQYRVETMTRCPHKMMIFYDTSRITIMCFNTGVTTCPGGKINWDTGKYSKRKINYF